MRTNSNIILNLGKRLFIIIHTRVDMTYQIEGRYLPSIHSWNSGQLLVLYFPGLSPFRVFCFCFCFLTIVWETSQLFFLLILLLGFIINIVIIKKMILHHFIILYHMLCYIIFDCFVLSYHYCIITTTFFTILFKFYFRPSDIFIFTFQNVDGLVIRLSLYLIFEFNILTITITSRESSWARIQGKNQQFHSFFFNKTFIWRHVLNLILLMLWLLINALICYLDFRIYRRVHNAFRPH